MVKIQREYYCWSLSTFSRSLCFENLSKFSLHQINITETHNSLCDFYLDSNEEDFVVFLGGIYKGRGVLGRNLQKLDFFFHFLLRKACWVLFYFVLFVFFEFCGFSNLIPFCIVFIHFRYGNSIPLKGCWKWKCGAEVHLCKTFTVKEVLHTLEIRKNLVSGYLLNKVDFT